MIAATNLTGGGGRARPTPAPATLSARLVEIAPPSVPEYEPIPAPQPTEPRRTAPEAQRRASAGPPRAVAAKTPHAVASPGSSDALAEGPDLTYYGARQLDVFPTLQTKLRFDPVSIAAGRALLLVMIDATGTVTDVNVVEAPASFGEDAARRAFMSARFTPAYRNGRAVRSRMLIEVSYDGGS